MKSERHSKNWPTPQDYNEAVQNLHVNTSDSELIGAEVETGPLGLPRPITGAFASVYKVRTSFKDLALRCFLRDIPDTQWRYGRIADYLNKQTLPYTVGFKFLFEGIKINGRWFPVLKMDWVQGQTLDQYVEENLHSGKLTALSDKFLLMCQRLHEAGMAHGDLQHGNIMLRSDDSLVLVDYDGMFVPHINAPHSNELGHRNYQHPQRNARDYGAYLDNFSAWVIYLSLKALAIDPSLFEQLGAGEDCLLFRREDFTKPMESCAFAALEKHADQDISRMARFLRAQLKLAPNAVLPLVSQQVPEFAEPEPMPDGGPKSRADSDRRRSAEPSPAPGMDPVDDPFDADLKDYLAEREYLQQTGQLNATPSWVTTAQLQNTAPGNHQQPAHIVVPSALFKPAPRKVAFSYQPFFFNQLFQQTAVAALLLFFFIECTTRFFHSTAAAILYATMAMLFVWRRVICDWWIVRTGTAVRGKIIKKDLRQWTTSNQSHNSSAPVWHHACLITYEYPKQGGNRIEHVTATIKVPDEHFREVDEDEEVVVVYTREGLVHLHKFSYFEAV